MKVIKYILLSLLVLLYGSQLYLGVMSTQIDDLPKLFGVGEVVFLSGSMQPAIDVGSLGIVHEEKNYEVGDIVTYIKDRTLITHRIKEIKSDKEIIVQGDANNVADEPITKEMIEGRIIMTIPHMGSVLQILKTPYGIAGVAGIGVIIALWPERDDDEDE